MKKIEIIINVIKEKNVDGMLLISPLSRNWLTSLNTSFGYMLINKEGKKIFITDSRYSLLAKEILGDKTPIMIISAQPNEDLVSFLKQAIKTLEIRNCLIEGEYISLNDYLMLQPLMQVVPFNARTLRISKDRQEIIKLQKAADIVVETINWVWTWIKPGMTEKQVAQKINIKFLELGATCNSFDTIVATGKNGAYPHHVPNDDPIKDGDMVTIDCGCMYDGLASDMTRSFIVGTKANNAEMIVIYNHVHKSQSLGLESASTAYTTKEIDTACRQYIDSTKYKGLFAHGTGHGVGMEVHELPVISSKVDTPLLPCSVLTVEPGIYVADVGGVRIEDTIIINKDQSILNLTIGCSKDLKYINNK